MRPECIKLVISRIAQKYIYSGYTCNVAINNNYVHEFKWWLEVEGRHAWLGGISACSRESKETKRIRQKRISTQRTADINDACIAWSNQERFQFQKKKTHSQKKRE